MTDIIENEAPGVPQVMEFVDGDMVTRDATPAEIAEIEAREVVDLDALKAAKNEEINRWRTAANFSTFPHDGKLIACDALSRSDIDGVANHIGLFGAFPDGFPGGWKATDNTMIALPDVDAFRAMFASMTAQGTANFNHSQALKRALAEVTTPEEVAAIEW
jgi:hypothetical protein